MLDMSTLDISPNPLANTPALISVAHAAKILGISRASAYRYAAAGELPVRRLGGRLFLVTEKLREFIAGTEMGGTEK